MKLLAPLLAIVAITALDLYALSQGIDGTLMIITVAIISGIAGHNVPELHKILKRLK